MQQGVAQRRAGQDQPALESFRQAQAISPSPRILAQIALAEQALGQWVDADHSLRTALADEADPWIGRNRGALETALNAIQNRLATVEITCNVPGAEIQINGRRRGTTPLSAPLRVEAGTANIELSLSGYYSLRRTLELTGSGSFRERFNLVEVPPATDPNANNNAVGNRVGPPPTVVYVPPPPASPRTIASTALLIGGAAMIAGGVGAHVYWQDRVDLYNADIEQDTNGTFTEGCFLSTSTYPRRADRCGAILSESWAGFGLAVTGYVLGAGALAAGVVLRLLPETPASVTATTARRRVPSASFACTPSLTPSLTGAQCHGTF